MTRFSGSDEDGFPFGYIPDDDEADEPAALPGDVAAGALELVDRVELAIGYRFQNAVLLEHSLTHSSIARTRSDSNERLEFLGDAIMGAVICEYLFQTWPEYAEGELTRIKSAVVSRHTCAKLSQELGLGEFLRLGKGLMVHEQIPSSILACAFESIVAAIYLDGGWETVKRFLLDTFEEEIDNVAGTGHGHNYKSQLQQLAQKQFGHTPVYRVLDEKGPDHSKCFHVAAVIGQRHYPGAWGPSKKIAEQNAARMAVEAIANSISTRSG